MAMDSEQEQGGMTPAMQRMIEQTGAVELAARIGERPPAPIGDSDRYSAEWVARLLCIGYGLKTPALAAADIVRLDGGARSLDRTEKFIRALGMMICFDALGWSRARAGAAWGVTETKARNCAKRGREWVRELNIAAAAQVVAGHVQQRLAPEQIADDVAIVTTPPPCELIAPASKRARNSRKTGTAGDAKKSRETGAASAAAE